MTKKYSEPANIPVTIIVCCYNAEATISDTLQTLQTQTSQPCEILVINDGSSDRSAEIIHEISQQDCRIRLLHNIDNIGIAASREKGLKESKTDLVIFFDSDDLAEQNLIERLYDEKLRDPLTLGVGSYCWYFGNRGDLGLQRLGPTSKEDALTRYREAKMLFMPPPTLFDRRDAWAVGGYRRGIMPSSDGIRYDDLSEDTDLWCRMSDLGEEGRYFLTIPEPLFRYRKTLGSLSTKNIHFNQIKMRWIKDCLRRRRSGRSEQSLAEFIASRTLGERLADWRSDKAATFYKRAGFSYASRSYVMMIFFLTIVLILSPKLIYQKFKTQVARL